MADWSQLPKELLDLIAKQLDTSFDVLHFRCVCSAWRSSVTPKRRRLRGSFPIIPNEIGSNGISSTSSSSFGFHLSKRTVFIIRSPATRNQTDHPNPMTTRSSWLVKLEEDVHNRKHLLNPLKRHRLEFSKVLDIENLSISEIGYEYVLNYINNPPNSNSSNEDGNLYREKVVLMYLDRKGDFDDFVLLTIHVSGKLAMFKSEDKKWTILPYMPSPFDDVILYKGKFYAVDDTGSIVFVDYSCFRVNVVANPVFGGDKKHLVECKGDLLLIDMYLSVNTATEYLDHQQLAYCMTERTVKFKVFKLDEANKEWIEVNDLNDSVLFLGEDCAFSVSIDDLRVCKGNCVIFLDNYFYLSGDDDDCSDVGVFDFDNGCIKPLGTYPELSKLFWPPPSWITPTISDVQNHIRELAL